MPKLATVLWCEFVRPCFMKRMGAHLEATEPVSQDLTGVGTDANIFIYQELQLLVAEDNAINQKVLLRI
jgi:hypothetical protein